MKTGLLMFILDIAIAGGPEIVERLSKIFFQFSVPSLPLTIETVVSNIEGGGIKMARVLRSIDIAATTQTLDIRPRA